MKAWTEDTGHMEVHRALSGWIVRRSAWDGRVRSQDVAGLSDDQALLDFFADQLSLPAPELPGPTPQTQAGEASAAAMVPPPVSGGVPERIGDLLRVFADAPDGRIMQVFLGDLRRLALADNEIPVSQAVADALAPLVKLARGLPNNPDTSQVAYEWCLAIGEIVAIDLGHVRAVLRAAGLFTDDMRPSQPPASQDAADASVKPAGEAQPPPADADEDGSYPPACTDPGGHKFEGTGTAYGGDDERWHGEGRMLCIHCGADGDA